MERFTAVRRYKALLTIEGIGKAVDTAKCGAGRLTTDAFRKTRQEGGALQ